MLDIQQELNKKIGKFFDDKDRRNRLMHDDWIMAIIDQNDTLAAVPMIHGSRRGEYDPQTAEIKIQEIWELARRFLHYRTMLRFAVLHLRDR